MRQNNTLNTIQEGEENSTFQQLQTLNNNTNYIPNTGFSVERLYTAPVYSYDGIPIVQMHQINIQ